MSASQSGPGPLGKIPSAEPGADSDAAQFNQLRLEAGVLLESRKYQQAIDCARRAVAIRPEDPRPYVQIAYGLAYLKQSESSKWAQKAISLEPGNGLWYGALADTYTLRGKWRRALGPLRKAVARSPEAPGLQAGLGLCFLRLGMPKKALPHLRKAVEIDPEKSDFHIRLSTGLMLTGDKNGAEAHLRKALELNPDSVQAQIAFGTRQFLDGNSTKAVEAFREALRLNPESVEAKVGLGLATEGGLPPLNTFLRYSLKLATSRYRKIIMFASVVAATEFLVLVPGSVGWPAVSITVALFAWVVYFIFSWRFARVIGKRRSANVSDN